MYIYIYLHMHINIHSCQNSTLRDSIPTGGGQDVLVSVASDYSFFVRRQRRCHPRFHPHQLAPRIIAFCFCPHGFAAALADSAHKILIIPSHDPYDIITPIPSPLHFWFSAGSALKMNSGRFYDLPVAYWAGSPHAAWLPCGAHLYSVNPSTYVLFDGICTLRVLLSWRMNRIGRSLANGS